MNKISVQKLNIYLARIKLNLESSPGPDGLTCGLYKTLTHEFCSVLAEVSNHFVQSGKLPNSFLAKSNFCRNLKMPMRYKISDAKIFKHIICNRIKKKTFEKW